MSTETSKLIVNLETRQAEANLKKLQEELKDLRRRYKEATSSDDKSKLKDQIKETEQSARELKKTLRERIQLTIDGQLAGRSMRDLETAARVLRKELRNLNPATQEFVQGAKKLQEIERRMQSLNDVVRGGTSTWNRLSDNVKSFGLVAAGYLGFQSISNSISGIVDKNAKLSDSLADIRKTTGLTQNQVKSLNEELSKIDTRTATADLREMAVVAGQLGIAQDKIALAEKAKSEGNMNEFNRQMKIAQQELQGFVESIDVANVALGDEFTGGAKEVADVLGKMRNVFVDVKSENVDQDLMHIGNALNELAAAGAATAPVVADFSNRIGGVGIPLGLTSSQVLGLSATLQELNVSTERGGTAVSKILQKMTTDTDKFAKVAGMSTSEFTNLVNKDLYGAFLKVVEGVGKGGQSATAFGEILNELGVDGAGASEVISKLSSNTTLLTQKVELAGTAIKGTDSITEEFGVKNATLAAEMDKLKKRFVDFVTSPALTNFLTKQVQNAGQFLTWLGQLPEKFEKNRLAIVAAVGAWMAYKGAVIQATVASWANTTAQVAQKVAYEAGFRYMVAQEAATKAFAMAKGVLTGKITMATAAQRIWNVVARANPIGLLITGLTALVSAFELYRRNTAEAIKLEKDKKALSDSIVKVNRELKDSQSEINGQIERFNQLSPTERQELQEKIRLKLLEAKATLAQLESDKKRVAESSTQVSTWQWLANAVMSGGNAVSFASKNVVDAFENGKEAGDKFNDGLGEVQQQIDGLEGQLNQVNSIQNAFKDAMAINAVTTEQFNEKLRLLRIALDNAAVGGEEYQKIAAEIQKVQQQMAAGTSAGKVDMTDVTQSMKDLNAEIRKMEQDMVNSQLGLHQKELNAVHDKYQNLRNQAAGNSEAIARIDALEKQELEQLESRHNQIIVGLRNQLFFQKRDQDQQELDDIRNKYQEQIDAFKGFQDKIAELEALRDAELAAKTEEQKQRKIKEAQDLEDQIRSLTQTAGENEIDAEANKWEQIILAAEQANADLLKNGEAAKFDVEGLIKAKNLAILALIKSQNEAELSEDQKKINKRKAMYIRTLQDVASISQSVAAMMQTGLQMLGAEEGEFAEFHKAIGLAQVVTDTAMAISSLTAASEANPANAITFGGAGAAQFISGMARILANIAQAKKLLEGNEVPKYEMRQGGFMPDGPDKVLEGPSHESGGLTIVNSQTGQVLAEMEGGEPVISRAGYAANKPVVDAIMDAKGGNAMNEIARILRFEDGGFMPSVFTTPTVDRNPPVLDGVRLRETILIEKSAAGAERSSGAFDFSQFKEMLAILKQIDAKLQQSDTGAIELSEALNRLNLNLENPTPGKSYVVYQDIEKAGKDLQKIKTSSGLKR